jgi:Zn-dependent protease with chaperone function
MKSWFGSWYASSHADPVEATVLANDKNITIGFRQDDGSVHTTRWDINDLQVSFDSSLQSTRVSHVKESSAKLMVAGKDALQFIQEAQAEQSKPWHKKYSTRQWGRNLLILLGISGALVTAFLLIVPWLSERLASTISIKTEEQLGDAVYDALALSAGEDKEASLVLNDFFDAMDVPTAYNVRITVVKNDIVNAFALPGGNIVVYTGLLKELKTYPELAALLSHEFTHVNNRHSTRSIFRRLGSRVFISLLLGNFGSVTSVLIDQADQFKSLNYSRKLEKEADMEGLALLKERSIDPEGFTALFKHLKAAAPVSSLPEFLGSHPDIDTRIAYIREASVHTQVEENAQLKSIFEKIK